MNIIYKGKCSKYDVNVIITQETLNINSEMENRPSSSVYGRYECSYYHCSNPNLCPYIQKN